jgi:hypothetical protein
MIVVALAVGIALAAWVHSQNNGRPPCKPERIEKRDSAGTVIEISTRTCLEHKQ